VAATTPEICWRIPPARKSTSPSVPRATSMSTALMRKIRAARQSYK
jgi:hypothetical protein